MDIVGKLLELLGAHWPFPAAMLVLASIGQVMKGSVWTEANFIKWREEKKNAVLWRFFWWGRATLPLHPVVGGVALSFIPGVPASPGVEGQTALALYFGFAGVMSTWAFALVRGWAKNKGYDLKIGQSVPPKKD